MVFHFTATQSRTLSQDSRHLFKTTIEYSILWHVLVLAKLTPYPIYTYDQYRTGTAFAAVESFNWFDSFSFVSLHQSNQ